MNRFATETQANQDPTPLGPGDYYYIIPEGFTQGSGVFPFKAGTNPPRTFSQLPYAPNRGFAVITNTSSGSVSGPATSTVGNIAIWDDTTGTLLADGPAPSDFATAAQGALANTAVQPGDPLTVLSSGAALNNYVPVADGAGNISWAPQSGGGSGDVTGPVSSVDNAVSRFDGTTGKVIQNSTVTISDAGAMNGIALLNGSSLPLTPGTLITTAAITNMVEIGDPLTDLSSGAATAGQVPEADGAGNITWTTPVGGGDVVGPASSVDGNVPQFDGTTGKLLKDGLGTSEGGNGAADAGKLLKFDPRGGIAARTDDAFSVDPAGDFRSSGIAKSISAVSTGSGGGIYAQASSGIAIAAVTGDQTAIRGFNNSTTLPSLEIYNDDPTNVGPIAHFHDDAGDGMEVLNDGGLFWTSATGAQTTATNLPAFGALTKGVVPAAGAVPSTSKFLDETGNWSTPPDTTGITQLTGDVTAGPGSGSQAATLASVITAGGPTGSASVVPVITYDAKGRLTAVTTATITPAAIGAPSGSGTSTGTNTGDQTNITGNAGTATALQTARTIQTDLASTSSASFDGTANITPGVTGTLSVANGGTGATTLTGALIGNGTAAFTTATWGNPTNQALAATVTFTAGAAPSGATNNTYNWTQIGHLVTYQFTLCYASAGTTVTVVTIALPSDMPNPVEQSGLTAGSDNLAPLTMRATNGTSGATTNGSSGSLRRNAGDTAYEFNARIASGTYSTFIIFGSYFTA